MIVTMSLVYEHDQARQPAAVRSGPTGVAGMGSPLLSSNAAVSRLLGQQPDAAGAGRPPATAKDPESIFINWALDAWKSGVPLILPDALPDGWSMETAPKSQAAPIDTYSHPGGAVIAVSLYFFHPKVTGQILVTEGFCEAMWFAGGKPVTVQIAGPYDMREILAKCRARKGDKAGAPTRPKGGGP